MNIYNIYIEEMNNYTKKINESKNEKEKKEKILAKLQKLSNNFPNIKSDLKEIEKNFNDGGFISDDAIFGQEELEKSYKGIDNAISLSESVKTALNKDIEALNEKINDYSQKYLDAYDKNQRLNKIETQ